MCSSVKTFVPLFQQEQTATSTHVLSSPTPPPSKHRVSNKFQLSHNIYFSANPQFSIFEDADPAHLPIGIKCKL